ncbi:MAG: hypothetical protein A2087_13025 [Spirochaetes bacterium GWD1_61_31]|nr:MAG: hypothetical protein A2Y37_02430 [Spirochaetes bacterium GWB1_60_80]OHD28565.1 MAG: hypothetical protein A2004_03005 [Spirochaetes bacterium GWC1_61_12]OHD39420.1 MAG: hypothetical protein A2087_13025 [Spirochaetes bacterium GWD1_61_31]OHD45475.1 MAG: hypothetical protein A2Y35_02700 [Spirochaetes bacterium GWE1_60_18]OHD58047.1 MAG: hypothetical protein A2Y32_05275 [Spirochaetes bacterium GWF1_60_12]
MADEIDPEIAALLGDVQEYSPKPTRPGAAASGGKKAGEPSFESLFGGMSVDGEVKNRGEFEIDLTKTKFERVNAFEQDPPNKFYEDPQYYQKALSAEGDEASRFHETLKKFLHATDPKDRGLYRQQVIVAYWNLLPRLMPKAISAKPLLPKQLMVRFGLALPTMLPDDKREIISRIVYQKTREDPVYYIDEWLRNIAMGRMTPSSTDEVRDGKNDERSRLNGLLQKAMGKRDTAEAVLKAKADERRTYEQSLRDRLELLCQHTSMPGFLHVPAPYTDAQKKTMTEMSEIFRKLVGLDKELIGSAEGFELAAREVESVKDKMGAMGEEAAAANLQTLAQELDTIRQMTKMCIGRQGNHFPLLTKEYFHLNLREVATRENIIEELAWLESVDEQVYCRPHKNMLNRIEPYVVLLPCYGDMGICWEPFDRFNRHTSRSRLAVPMYPRKLRIAFTMAAADMRWQAAKEKASHYWMQEGLTGQYYQWFLGQKLKGDVKSYFIEDYITWVTKESEGIQKLDKEIRAIFWRLMPFRQDVKEKLRDRSFAYQELYQRDVNKTLSDGY